MTVSFKKISFIVLCLWVRVSCAQIQQATSHYMFNPQVTNPAFYGNKDGINFGANYRHQWSKLEGQPRTVNIFADANLPQAHGGIGFNITNDMLGAYSNTSIHAGYAFIQNFGKKIKLAVGISGGATFSKLDGSRLITPQGTGPDQNDDALSNQVQKSIRPDLSAGIALVHKYVEVGVAYTNLINAKDKFKGQVTDMKPVYGGVFQIYAGSKVKIKENFYVRPSLMLNTDFKEFQTDFSFMAGYRDFVGLGVNVRGYNKKSFESLSPVISIGPVKNICIIYSYDVSLSKLSSVNKGSHEITLNYLLPNNMIYKNPKIINNPRFL